MEGKYTMIRSKIIFVVLFVLSFSIFHDTLMPLLEKNIHTDTVHYVSDNAPTKECADLNKIHSMLHFMAIVMPTKDSNPHFAKSETIPHLLVNYTPPLEKTSHKPPIV
jgi:hypothetical protein